jgi:two-component system, response regulator PdtaR
VRRLWRVSAPETTPEAAPSTSEPKEAAASAAEASPKPAPKPTAPKAVASSEAEVDPASVPNASGTPARRVVVAEDEALIRLDIVEMLREAGFDVVGEAGDGEEAVRLAEELKPDLVVLDVKMPVLDGISAAERIVGARIAPVVLLTAFSQRELVERARDAGAMAYVVKPFTSADLMPALEIALSRHAEIAALESEVADLQQRFETRKVVDRAKGLLQSRFGMTEPEAFRWIQKTSMDKRLTMREVAQAVIGAGDEKASS